eukprot:SAG31_NODE_43340_length_267_cov_0.928571_1_plen_34_part_01
MAAPSRLLDPSSSSRALGAAPIPTDCSAVLLFLG